MIGLDTNVIIRYLVQDDPRQSSLATQLIEQYLSLKAPGYITLLTLVEITWVLESCYKQPSDAIRAVLRKMLSTKVLVVQQADIATRALERYEQHGGDFSDAVMAVTGETSGCTTTLTFDKGAIRHGMILLEQSSLAKL